ncbi:MAG: hypothetical protein C0601_06755 [Candidatus Muiribacterium halophilum]|uniref:Uncharacterized protein n=1 Tax=Muiribacterium halophilum TaxID=2053465 RepID=A0A2N5ZG96_MUIH1|nr:MAG: hypothetical protein C0601_06755 [Candidatus Muirbacterium halophilum]
MKKDVVLVPAQSKRLIAKAFLQSEVFSGAIKDKKIIICKGTTNSYVVEEFLKKKIDKERFTTGVVMPGGEYWIENEKMLEYVIDKGVANERNLCDVIKEINPGDIILKGANSINYAKETAGILIRHPEGGTVKRIFEAVFGKRANLIIPVGLEKEVSYDLDEVSLMLSEDDCCEECPRMYSFKAQLFTEIEAIKVLTLGKVSSYHIATGGIKGAQGAIRLLLNGEKEYIEEIEALIERLPLKDEFDLRD